HKELIAEPDNLGLCDSVSRMLYTILKQEGIWSYIVRGNVRVDFASHLNLPIIFTNDPPFDDGHAWVVAPPFGIIDLTIKYQHYTRNEQKYIPDYIMAESKKMYEYHEEFNYIDLPSACSILHNN